MDTYTFTSQLIRRWSRRFTTSRLVEVACWAEKESQLTLNVGFHGAPALIYKHYRFLQLERWMLFIVLVLNSTFVMLWRYWRQNVYLRPRYH